MMCCFTVSDDTRIIVKRILALCSGCWCNLIAGLALSLTIYMNAIKDTFYLDQTELEVVASSFALGNGFSILPGIILDFYGSRVASIVGTILYGIGSGLILLSVALKSFHLHRTTLLAAYFFIAGHGTSYLNLTSMTVNSLNFSAEYRGLVVMILDIFYATSPIFYAPLYEYVYKNGHNNRANKQDLWGFSLFLLIFGTCAGICQIFFGQRVKPFQKDEFLHLSTSGELTCSSQASLNGGNGDESSSDTLSSSPDLPKDEKPRSSLQKRFLNKVLRYATDKRFVYIFWISTFVGAVANVILGNTTAFTRSLRLSDSDIKLIVFPALFGIFFHAFIGPLSDKLECQANRSSVWMIANIGITMGVLLLIAVPANYQNGFAVILISQCLGHAGQAGLIFLFVIVTERFKEADCGKLIGMALLCQNLIGLLLQTIFGAVYDSELDKFLQSSNSSYMILNKGLCYGDQCYRYGLIIDFVLALVAVCITAALIVHDVTEDNEITED